MSADLSGARRAPAMSHDDARRALAGADAALAHADAVLDQAQWLSIKKYARVYGVDRGTVYKWLAHGGILEVYQVGTLRRIRHQPPREKCA